jgi:DNA repair protein RadC
MIARVPGAGASVSVLLGLVPALAAHAIRPGEMQVLDSAGAVRQYLRERLGLMRRERLVALLLDSSGRLLAEKDLEFGTVDRASVHPRNLLEKVIAANATGVILVHNHPGGRAEPSSEDLALTSRLQELGKSLGFRVLDHFIVTEEATVSLRELGRMSQ